MENFAISDNGQIDDQSIESSDASFLLPDGNDSPLSVTRPLDLALDKQQNYPKRYLLGIVVASALGSFLWGYHTSVIAGAMLFVDDHFNLTVLWHEVVVSVAIAGATVGVVTAGMLSDRLGRWKVMMASAVLFGFGSAILGLSFFKSFLVVGRAVVGLASGIYSVIGLVYVSEMSPSHIRGRLALASYLHTGGGILSGSIAVGLFSLDTEYAYTLGWRFMFGFGLLPSFCMVVVLCFLFETPRWLVHHGRGEKAFDVMRKIRNAECVEKELDDIIKDYQQSQGKKLGIMQSIKRTLKTKEVLYATFIGCSIQVFSALSGPVALTSYSSTILRMAGFTIQEAVWFTAVPSFANLVGKIIGAISIDKVGRRKLFIVSGTGASLFLYLLAVSFYLENSSSLSVVPLNAGGKCGFDKCGFCVANSQCGFCAITNGNSYHNATCSEGNKDQSKYRTNGTQCVTWNEYKSNSFETDNGYTNHSFHTEWLYEHCPDSKFAALSLVALIMYMASFSSGLISVTWIVNSEIYPMWARSQGAALSSLLFWIMNLFENLIFLTLFDVLGTPVALMIYGSVAFTGVLFATFLLPETSKQPLEGIEKLFSRPYFLTWCNRVSQTLNKSDHLNMNSENTEL